MDATKELGPLGTLPQPPNDGSEKSLEEKIVEHIEQQKQKKLKKGKKKKEKEEPPREEDPDLLKRNVEYFFPREKGAGQLFVLVGKSERGKTHFLRWLLYSMCLMKKEPFQYGLVMVRTKFKASYRFHWATEQNCKIYEGFRQDILQRYVENLKQRYQQNGYLEPSFIVFDDLVGILNSSDRWMQNFFGTYRHYNISVFVAVQYLTGRNSISPIMREQTSYCIMFNSKVQRTLIALWENYGQMMPKKDFFAHLSHATDPEVVGTKHACVVYAEHIDKLEHNYASWLAPATLPDGEVMLKGPDKPKPPSKKDLMKEQRLAQFAWRAPSWLPKTLNLSQQDHAMLQRMMHYADAASHRLRDKSQSLAAKDRKTLRNMVQFEKDAEAAAAKRWEEQQREERPRPPAPSYSYVNDPTHRMHPYRTPTRVRRARARPPIGTGALEFPGSDSDEERKRSSRAGY